MPHPPDQLPTIYHQPFGTMPTIFLWKEQHKNDAGSLPTHGQETGKIREFAHGSESRRFSHCHTVLVEKMMRAPVRSRRYAPAKTGHFAARADRKSERLCHDRALPCVNDVSADEVRYLNQKPSQPGILLKQRVQVVAGFVTPK